MVWGINILWNNSFVMIINSLQNKAAVVAKMHVKYIYLRIQLYICRSQQLKLMATYKSNWHALIILFCKQLTLMTLCDIIHLLTPFLQAFQYQFAKFLTFL